jgi:hypothetical protein
MYNRIIEIYHIQISRPAAVGNGTYSTVVKIRKEKGIDIKTFQKFN